eukprot:scaffold89249_cov35-Attheya_sp.AAC.1
MDAYKLWSLVANGYIYARVDKGMYNLPQAGKIAQERLTKVLEPYGYAPAPITDGLWVHKSRPITFTLVVDDFGVKYTGREHALHLQQALESTYKITTDWDGALYIGITLKWDYANERVFLCVCVCVCNPASTTDNLCPMGGGIPTRTGRLRADTLSSLNCYR